MINQRGNERTADAGFKESVKLHDISDSVQKGFLDKVKEALPFSNVEIDVVGVKTTQDIPFYALDHTLGGQAAEELDVGSLEDNKYIKRMMKCAVDTWKRDIMEAVGAEATYDKPIKVKITCAAADDINYAGKEGKEVYVFVVTGKDANGEYKASLQLDTSFKVEVE